MGYFLASNSDVDNYVTAIAEGGADEYNSFLNAMNNTQSFIANVKPYVSSGNLPNYFNLDNVSSNVYAIYIQAKPDFVADGFAMLETQLQSAVKNLKDQLNLILAYDIGIISYWNQRIQYEGPGHSVPQLRATSVLIVSSIPSDRLLATDHDAPPTTSGGSGAMATPELEYLVGGMWGTRNFDEDQFQIENAMRKGFLPTYRPPDFGGHIPASNNKANIHIIDLNGVCYMSYAEFKVMQIDKVEQNDITRISSLDGDKISFSCSKNDMIRVSGVLLDTPESDQARLWEYNWETYINGYINAYNQCQAVLAFDNQWVVGYILSSKTQSDSDTPYLESLSFTMHVSDQKVTYKSPKRGHKVYEGI